MPTLDWIGKKAVVNHHREVGYRLLKCDQDHSVGDPEAGNLIVQGDNLLALKALLPHYAGQVKCIYIDPPYNTGNEGWVYNDAVNSPEMRNWLGKVVGKEAEDLSRHDKWLCMMYPRLSLLRQFLRNDGVILISIDDFETQNLRYLMDEVFGPSNFIAQLVWDKTRKNDAKFFSAGHEYILVYARSLKKLKELKTVWREQKPGTKEVLAKWRELCVLHGSNYDLIQNELRDWYKSLDKKHPAKKLSRTRWVDEYGPWRDRDISWPGGGGPRYDVIHPVTGLPCKVPEAGWRFATLEEMNRQIKLGLVVFREDHTEPPIRKAHLMPIAEEAEQVFPDSEETAEEDLDEDAGLLVMPSVIHKQAQVAVKLLREIFNGKKVFENPKDHEVIARLIKYVTKPGDIILDSFAGSGTTGHSVLQLNKEEKEDRRFILVEMDEKICREVTTERVRRVIQGYTDSKDAQVPGLNGGFRLCRLGESLFNPEGLIREEVTFADFARFVFFMETGSPQPSIKKLSPLLGTFEGRAVYLLFNGILKDKSQNGGNSLTHAILAGLPSFDGPKVIYGARCLIGAGRLRQLGITFKQLPYDLKVER